MLRGWSAIVALTVVVCLGLAGCEDEEPSSPATGAQADNGETPGNATPEVSPTPTAPEVLPAIVSATNSISSGGYEAEIRLDLNELVGDDQIATVNFTITVESSTRSRGESSDRFPVSDIFGEEKGDRTVGGAYLVDPAEQKRYLVYRDTEGACVCSELLRNLPVGQPVAVFASFPAPPPTTESMTVVIPNFPSFKDIPVTGPEA